MSLVKIFIRPTLFRSLICVALFLGSSLQAQDQSIADSLIDRIHEEDLSDSLRYIWLKEISFNESDTKIKLEYARQLQEISKQNSNDQFLMHGLFLEGIAHRLSGDLSGAMEVYFQCAKLAERLSMKAKVGEIYNELANVFSVAGNHKNALKYYYKAIEILRAEKDSIFLPAVLTNMGDEYFNIEGLDSALILFEESGLIFEAKENRSGVAYNLGNLGLVYAKQNRHKLAEKTLKEATEILEELGDQYAVAIFGTFMADIYFQKEDLQRALFYALKSYDIGMIMGLKEQVRDASLKLSEIHESMGNFEEAFEFQKQYISYRDSMNNEEAIQKMADLRREYELSQKQAKIDLLESQKLVQKVLSYSMIGLVLLLGLLAYVFYKNYKQKDATNHLLEAQKEEIAAQRDQLEAMNETRDRFFSIISHDLLGPVNSFKAFSTLIQLCIEQNDIKGLAEIQGQFTQSVNGLSALLGNLLDWAVTQQGAIPYNPEKVNVKVISDELVDIYINMATAKKITLESTVEPEVFLHADVNAARTILRNLINNAIKFTDGGSVIISTETTPKMVTVKVRDTGIGISKEKLVNLMQSNDYNRSWGTKGEKGVGIGLQLVKELTNKNKGTITIDSIEGTGTTVCLSLPAWKLQEKPVDADVVL